MKLSAISIAIVLASVAGVASAAGQIKALPQVKVSAGTPAVAGCSPALHPESPACHALRAAILARYPAWQLSIIYGATTSNQVYIDTGARKRLVLGYEQFLQQYDRDYMAAHARFGTRVAGK